MVKLEDIPSEGERYELDDLPTKLTLKALSEKMIQGTTGKAGGLQIEYEDPNGKRLTQKYTKVSGKVLNDALKKLKVKDTIDLQQAFYVYERTSMRTGFPRMIPIQKVKTQ